MWHQEHTLRAGDRSIEDEIKTEMECFFNTSFDDTRVYTYCASRFPDKDLIPPAFTDGKDVFIDSQIYRSTPLFQYTLLSHEFAHVVQKKLGASEISGASYGTVHSESYEIEAHLASLSFITGGLCPKLSPDRNRSPRAWGEAGHYYTIYLVALAAGLFGTTASCAGLPEDIGAKLAFFAQMPDQVAELDAICCGLDLFMAGLPGPGAGADLQPSFDTLLGRSRVMERSLDVQLGLHALTGRNAARETEIRLSVLNNLNITDFRFGLALHPLGDSFAHRDSSGQHMHTAPAGHLFEGSAPDNINLKSRKSLYKMYGQELFKLFCVKTGTITKRPADESMLDKWLELVSSHSKSWGQIAEIRSIASADANGLELMPSYCPEKEYGRLPDEWSTFRRKHSGLTDYTLQETLRLAKIWRNG